MCLYPLKAYAPLEGKKPVFNPKYGYIDKKIQLPCGQCTECRLKRSREWAIRCMHEARCHEHNSFITLTYNDDNLPHSRSIDMREHQTFVKRLRKYFDLQGKKFKYYMCAEYGENTFRPHYHYCLFGVDFDDKKYYKRNHMKQPLYTSPTLEKIWAKGYAVIGDVSFESAAYVSRYIMKKINGDMAQEHYNYTDPNTGQTWINLTPEFNAMSLKTAIGKEHYQKFHTDIFPSDECIVKGKKMKPPSYYMKLFQIDNEEMANYIKSKRKVKAIQNPRTELENNAKIYNFSLKMKKLKRGVE